MGAPHRGSCEAVKNARVRRAWPVASQKIFHANQRAAKSFARQRLISQVVLAPFRSSTRANLRLLLLSRGAGLT